MTVILWFDGLLDTEEVDGDLLDVSHQLNTSVSNGRPWAVFGQNGGEDQVVLDVSRIVKIKEKGNDAYVS